MKQGPYLEDEAVRRVAEDAALARRRVPSDAEAGLDAGDARTARRDADDGVRLESVSRTWRSSPMANGGKETLFSMGDDIALAVLSESPQPLYDYFKQRFAQVTNPPIDPLREGVVMSLEMTLGKRPARRHGRPRSAAECRTPTSPVLNDGRPQATITAAGRATPRRRLDALPDRRGWRDGLKAPRRRGAVRRGGGGCRGRAPLLVLSTSRDAGDADDADPARCSRRAPSTTTSSAQARTRAAIVVESATPSSTHHFACLVGYGASAVHPYRVEQRCATCRGPERAQARQLNAISEADALERTARRGQGDAQGDPLQDRHLAVSRTTARRSSRRSASATRSSTRASRARRRASAASASTTSPPRRRCASGGVRRRGAGERRLAARRRQVLTPASTTTATAASMSTTPAGEAMGPRSKGAARPTRASTSVYQDDRNGEAGDDPPRHARVQESTARRSPSTRSSPSRRS